MGRIAGLSADLARKAEEHASGLAELDGLRRHSLLQIDQARGETRHWKREFERVDHENKTTLETYRQKASTLANELAAARGRLGAVEDALATAQLRVVALEAALSAARVTTTSGRLNKASTRGTGNLLRRRKF